MSTEAGVSGFTALGGRVLDVTAIHDMTIGRTIHAAAFLAAANGRAAGMPKRRNGPGSSAATDDPTRCSVVRVDHSLMASGRIRGGWSPLVAQRLR
jgi:hypothetical protein